MSVETLRRFYLLKRLAAARRFDDALASAWRAKQEAESSTPLVTTFPHRARLIEAGYSAREDLVGATIEELQQVGFGKHEAAAVLAAL